ncbi:fungal-specific transcription factor domain-containing protein [Microdochium trichocladiopsis]|uniref:Fungal-specific transcription factor domain-containing protein n=1 Tax=Microdochium trichocladiopsis TaxID=1682393 RepID=A0A9P8XV54_9PEZI|nr:fungal-specific transcription factor domain-containing protein [Microdochium trichocladiopsis]KAH7020763.1 fungal-specific transcription factor domain-containing protein [Microdochium trichocladiopsis]
MTPRSAQACLACKQLKRRCDKVLPECSLCRRTSRSCLYGIEAGPLPTPGEWADVQARLAALENILPGFTPPPSTTLAALSTPGNDCSSSLAPSSADLVQPIPPPASPNHGDTAFPAALFVDLDCYIWSHARLPAPSGSIPAPVLALLSQDNCIIDASRSYFATIHKWLPIVSKKRLDMGLPVRSPGPDLAMLFLAMRVVTNPLADHQDLTLYRAAKDFLAQLEAEGCVSLLVLQAMVLIAVFEYGQAIYPAAWMTVGACARYADILGLAPGEFSLLGQLTTWTESEERRRVWWAISVLDKLVVVGGRRRPMLSESETEPRLPVDDDVWDLGDASKAFGYPTDTPHETPQPGFARLCQASVYLNRAIRSARAKPTVPSPTEVMALADELQSFASAVDRQGGGCTLETRIHLLASGALARSALFLVLDRCTCPEKMSAAPGYIPDPRAKTTEEIDLQIWATAVTQATSRHLHSVAMDVLALVRRRHSADQGAEDQDQEDDDDSDDTASMHVLGLLGPFVLDAMYESAATFHWFAAETGDESLRAAAADMDGFLDAASSRWRLASVYRENMAVYAVDKNTVREHEGRW